MDPMSRAGVFRLGPKPCNSNRNRNARSSRSVIMLSQHALMQAGT